MSNSSSSPPVSVGIVGAGFGGLGAAIQLKQKLGLQHITIWEAADGLGGTWRVNKYPGCACDIPSVMYSYSFEPCFAWTKHYADQPQILSYLHHCADKYELWPHIQLNTRVSGAHYDADRAVWRVTTAAGAQHEVQVLVLAQGSLSKPSLPDISGLSGFKGATMHTARWDDTVELAGRKVAVVGTGASAIQVIPKLQEVAKELVVFQRTPAWVLPRKELTPKYAVPAAQHGNRFSLWLQRAGFFLSSELLVGRAMVGNKRSMLAKIEQLSLKHMRAAVKDPKLLAQLTPDYSVGCKRILSSDDYYPALAQDNVTVVASGLSKVLEDGTTLVADNGQLIPDVDVVVFATGFNLTAPLKQFDIRTVSSSSSGAGASTTSLDDTLRATPEQLYGMAVAGYPNLWTILGFNSGLGHMSVVFMIECQVNLIVKLIRSRLLSQGLSWVAPRPDAQHAFNTELQRRLQKTVWLSGGCNSWYLASYGKAAQKEDDDSSGRSGGVVMWPGLCTEFWWRTLWPRAKDWEAGKAAAQHPPASALAAAAAGSKGGGKGGAVARKETPLQELLPDSGDDKKGV